MALENKSTIPLDGQGNPLIDNAWSPLRCEKLITFAGGTTNAWGDDGGTLDGGALFHVTGTVRLRIIGVVETDLVGAATVEVGIAGNTAGLLTQISDATSADVGEIWHDATLDAGIELSSVATEKIIANGADIILTVGTTNITAGAIRFIVSWFPVSAGALVEPSAL